MSRLEVKDARERARSVARELAKLRARRKLAVAKLRALCKSRRQQVAKKAKALREAYKLETRRTIERLRLEARTKCERSKRKISLAYMTEKARGVARKKAHEQRALDLREAAQAALSPAQRKARMRALERRQEATESALRDIPRELHGVFRRVHRTIPPATRRADGSIKTSKAERFLEWAEENPDLVLAITEANAERSVKKLVKEKERMDRVLQMKEARALRKAGYSDSEARGLRALGIDPGRRRKTGGGDAPF